MARDRLGVISHPLLCYILVDLFVFYVLLCSCDSFCYYRFMLPPCVSAYMPCNDKRFCVHVPTYAAPWLRSMKTIKTSPPLPSCWLCVSLVSPPEKVSMLSALIAPFKYISPGTSSTEDEDSLSKLLFLLSLCVSSPSSRANVEMISPPPTWHIIWEIF